METLGVLVPMRAEMVSKHSGQRILAEELICRHIFVHEQLERPNLVLQPWLEPAKPVISVVVKPGRAEGQHLGVRNKPDAQPAVEQACGRFAHVPQVRYQTRSTKETGEESPMQPFRPLGRERPIRLLVLGLEHPVRLLAVLSPKHKVRPRRSCVYPLQLDMLHLNGNHAVLDHRIEMRLGIQWLWDRT